jgi:dihydroorotate dehydrogenase
MQLKKEVGDKLCLIGVGGIDSVESASAKFKAGADLIQLYTGFIYRGPGLISEIRNSL